MVVFFPQKPASREYLQRSWVRTLLGVHVKVSSYMSYHPKTQKRSPDFSWLKVLCKTVKALILNSFWAGKGYPPQSLLMASWLVFFHKIPHLENISREVGFVLRWGSMLRYLPTWAFIQKLKNDHLIFNTAPHPYNPVQLLPDGKWKKGVGCGWKDKNPMFQGTR